MQRGIEREDELTKSVAATGTAGRAIGIVVWGAVQKGVRDGRLTDRFRTSGEWSAEDLATLPKAVSRISSAKA